MENISNGRESQNKNFRWNFHCTHTQKNCDSTRKTITTTSQKFHSSFFCVFTNVNKSTRFWIFILDVLLPSFCTFSKISSRVARSSRFSCDSTNEIFRQNAKRVSSPFLPPIKLQRKWFFQSSYTFRGMDRNISICFRFNVKNSRIKDRMTINTLLFWKFITLSRLTLWLHRKRYCESSLIT